MVTLMFARLHADPLLDTKEESKRPFLLMNQNKNYLIPEFRIFDRVRLFQLGYSDNWVCFVHLHKVF